MDYTICGRKPYKKIDLPSEVVGLERCCALWLEPHVTLSLYWLPWRCSILPGATAQKWSQIM